MKKNVMMRVASVLLICVLLTSSVISGTFAKYVTTGSSNDTARVAKFGVVITGTTGNANQAFAQEYAKDDDTYTLGGVTVAASENVVAPGTSGTFSNFAITGKPEVAVRVTYAPTIQLTNWLADTDNDGLVDDEYCPIIIYVNDVPYYINGVDIMTVDQLVNAVNGAVVAKTADYAPGTDLSAVNDDLNIRWAWAFADGTPIQEDEYDTDLGNWALNENYAPVISISVTCTVTQID